MDQSFRQFLGILKPFSSHSFRPKSSASSSCFPEEIKTLWTAERSDGKKIECHYSTGNACNDDERQKFVSRQAGNTHVVNIFSAEKDFFGGIEGNYNYQIVIVSATNRE